MRRRWVIVVAAIVGVVFVCAATVPWWLQLVLPATLRQFGVTYQGYEGVGYARFALRAVSVRRAGVLVTATRVEADTPLRWYWNHLRGAPTPVLVGNWIVKVEKRTVPAPKRPSGWIPLRSTLQRVTVALDRWLPLATTSAGRVEWPGGGLALRSASWNTGTLKVKALRLGSFEVNADVTVTPSEDRIAATVTAGADSSLVLESRGLTVNGTVTEANQPASVAARFAGEGWLPSRAEVNLPEITISGGRIRLPQYASVSGHLHVDWVAGHFLADVVANGTPEPGRSVPPLGIKVHARGDPHELTVDTLHATLPGAVAELSAPVTIERNGKVRQTTARFSVRADLASLTGDVMKGIVTGEARVVPDLARAPVVEFTLEAGNLELRDASFRRVEIGGRLSWPHLEIARLAVDGGDGSKFTAHGAWDFRTKEVSGAELDGMIRRAVIARWIPAAIQFEQATFHGQASGPIQHLAHDGRAALTGLRFGELKSVDVTATWRGAGRQVDAFSIEAATKTAQIRASGSANGAEANLATLEFLENGVRQLQLARPARIQWRPTLGVDQLELSGPEGATVKANLAWGLAGRIEAEVQGFRSSWITAWMHLPGPEWTIPSLAATGSWTRGPMTYSVAGGMASALGDDRTATINFAVHGDGAGLQVDSVHAVESGHAVVDASGRAPVTIEPGANPLVRFDPAGALRIAATTVPNAAFWQQLAALTGLELHDPQVTANLAGTWLRPRGTIQFRATRAAMDPKRFQRALPSIDSLDVAVTGDPDGIRLDRFDFSIEGQPVQITGRLPVANSSWTELTKNPAAFLRRGASLRLRVPDAEVAMFSRFLPSALAPAGRLQADVRFDRGALGGYVRLRNAASRPLGPLGVLQQVNAEVTFSDHQIELRDVTATAGGQPVRLSGTVTMPERSWWSNATVEPKYDIVLQGENLPFVRQAGLLVRGDLNLKLQSPSQGPPRISGDVTLRDSLFLSDVRAFLPHGGGASPSRRPPYFSIATPPLNTWGLSVEVTGTRFMRLRTPVFAGVASARFHLGGTLGAPRAIGDATIDQGSVLMPFANFAVQQGAVRLTEEDPYEPTIYLRGSGRHYGYDLTIEITGKASAPKIAFTSSPALDSEQVLLMVMTGAAPSSGVATTTTHRAVQIGAFFGESILGSLTGGGGQEKLTVESGEKISLQGKETYQIEYKLNDRWSLTGEYDEFDEYNAGFKWRVAPKHGRKGDQLDAR